MTADLFKSKKNFKRCCHSHPVLKIGHGEIVGASCGTPREGYDIYIGLCYTMKFQHQPYPWDQEADPIIEFQYTITDGCAPKSPKEFKKMIEWVALKLHCGNKIHVGCIGGHGRTGLFLAALVAFTNTSDDPIKWVRENHCKKAVESKSQVNFLMKHFGCKTAKPSKPSYSGTQTGRHYHDKPNHKQVSRLPLSAQDVVVDAGERISCMHGKGSIWG